MKLVDSEITKEELRKMAAASFGNLVKAVVDASLHADEEAYLLTNGSNQIDLWGINLYPEMTDEDFIEFDSMINLRPNQGNKTRGIDDEKIQEKIKEIVRSLVK